MTEPDVGGHASVGAGPRPQVVGADAALAELATLDALPVERHVDVYERAHRQLQDAMADTDDA